MGIRDRLRTRFGRLMARAPNHGTPPAPQHPAAPPPRHAPAPSGAPEPATVHLAPPDPADRR